jgi:hypothetical protein
MLEISFDLVHILIFVIPGFIIVWSFRYFTDSKKSADFEYFALSTFWGLLNLLFYELISRAENVKSLLQNPYAATFVLSIFGLIIGWFGGVLSRTDWFQKIINWLKNYHF